LFQIEIYSHRSLAWEKMVSSAAGATASGKTKEVETTLPWAVKS